MRCPRCGSDDRSVPQLRRFFKVVKVAYDYWPERSVRPTDSEHLRAWLLCKVGWRTEVSVEIEDGQAADVGAQACKSLMKALGHHVWVVPRKDALVIIAPRSISFAKADHKTMCKVFADVEDVICREMGIESCDQLLREAERAA
jgi:hypothetical protein